MIRVLFACESFHPILGGGEKHLRAVSRALAAQGFGATVVTRRSEAGWPEKETLDGVRVLRVGPPGPARAGKYLMLPRAWRALRRELPRHDLLVVRGTRVLGLPSLLAARLSSRPVVLQPEINGELSGAAHAWGTPLAGGAGEAAIRWLARARNLWLGDADALVAMSREIVREARDAGFPQERVAHIPHGVDCARFRPSGPPERAELRARLGLEPAAVIVAYTGRLLRGKGLEALIAAFDEAGRSRPGMRLVVVGSGEGQALSVEAELRRDVSRRGLDGRVTFTGRVEAVEDYLRASDLFALPSEFEALGLSLIEACACGLACVGARTGGIVDVIEDGVSGRLVEPGAVPELAAALAALADDAEARERLGRAARQAALDRFDEEVSLARYRALFAELATRARRAA